jgi:hypothetical protein
MMRQLHLAAIIAFLTATSASAQNQGPAPRAIGLPDTLGANFAVTDTLSGKSGPADYDFLVGTWRFTFQARNRDGSFTPPFTGHWVFTKKQTGGQVQVFRHSAGQVLVARRCHIRSRQNLAQGLLDHGSSPHLAVTTPGRTVGHFLAGGHSTDDIGVESA